MTSELNDFTGDDWLKSSQSLMEITTEEFYNEAMRHVIANKHKKHCFLKVEHLDYDVLRAWCQRMSAKHFAVKFRRENSDLIDIKDVPKKRQTMGLTDYEIKWAIIYPTAAKDISLEEINQDIFLHELNIEKEVTEVSEMFHDLLKIVNQQGEFIDQIDAVVNVEKETRVHKQDLTRLKKELDKLEKRLSEARTQSGVSELGGYKLPSPKNRCSNVACITDNCPGCRDDSWGVYTYSEPKDVCPMCGHRGSHAVDGSMGVYYSCRDDSGRYLGR